MNIFKRTYFFSINEIRQDLRTPLPFIVAFVMPVIAWLVLMGTFSTPVIEDCPMIVVDKDNSQLSRTIIRYLESTQSLKIIEVTKDEDAARNDFEKGKSFINIVIPKGLEEQIKRGSSSEINIISNGAALLYTRVSYRSIATGILTVSSGIQIKRLQAKGLTFDEAKNRIVPINTVIQALSNPWYDYRFYLVPGMAIAILQMSGCFSTLWLFRQHREHASGRVIPNKGSRTAFITGRLIPLFLANLAAILFLFIVVLPWAGIPVNNNYLNLFMMTVLYVFTSMGIGAFLSILLSNLVTGVQISILVNAPAFVFCGYTYPKWAMPEWIQYLSQILPLTHLMDAYFSFVIFDKYTTNGLAALLITASIFWGLVLVLCTGLGERFRKSVALLKGKKEVRV